MSELFEAEADPSSLRVWDLYTPFLLTDSDATGIMAETTGKLSIRIFDISTLTKEEIADVIASFVDAMAEQLQNILPAGAVISITSISTVGNRRRKLLEQVEIDYKCEMHLGIDDDGNSRMDAIDQSLSDVSALTIRAILELSGSDYSTVKALAASLTIDSHIPGTHTVSSLMKWYPDWREFPSACKNDGKYPPYMEDDNADSYLYDTQEECCLAWFAFSDCPTTDDLSVTKFYPDWKNSICGHKSNFEPWELDELYDSLDDCCTSKFSWNMNKCCNAPGLGGCANGAPNPDEPEETADVKYLPDWTHETCYAKTTGALESYEVSFSSSKVRDCCNSFFSWEADGCCKRSGGC